MPIYSIRGIRLFAPFVIKSAPRDHEWQRMTRITRIWLPQNQSDFTEIRLKYKFHLTNVNDEMVFRYDNAPHHLEIATYPHHKQVKGEKVPRRSKEVGLKDVLLEIEEMICR
jgi:hypothetical protein